MAIILDDAGGSLSDVEAVIAIGRPVAVAVLPGLAHSSEVARRAVAAGLEVLLHLPVEAHSDNEKLGPGAVRVAMSDEDIRSTVRAGLASVPGAIGVNNHMGSRGTADARVMRAILEVVRERGLLFVDSRTTKDTVAESLAAEMGVPTARRHVFLDNEDDEEAIRGEVLRLISLARAQGEAIAIGHAQRLTPRVVARMLDEFDRQGVRIVPLSVLVR
ncbi:MAG: divergent polysaccharide deacetylase family protein [Armatimonadota bacterium]|nr:divergent polysaccharide deacetylase family protein [Armatimonadota bacterium]